MVSIKSFVIYEENVVSLVMITKHGPTTYPL